MTLFYRVLASFWEYSISKLKFGLFNKKLELWDINNIVDLFSIHLMAARHKSWLITQEKVNNNVQ